MAETFPRVTQRSESIGATGQTHQGSSDSPADKSQALQNPDWAQTWELPLTAKKN